MRKLFCFVFVLLISQAFSQNRCNNRILKLNNGSIDIFDSSGVNKTSSILSNVIDFDCNDKEVAVVKNDGGIGFYDFSGNTKFTCSGTDNVKIKYWDEKTYVLTKKDGKMYKYQSCNNLGNL